MKHLQAIFEFIGLSMGRFLGYFFSYMFYFFLVLAVTIPVFLWGYRFTRGIYFLAGYLVILAIVNAALKRSIFIKQQFHLNLAFIDFLESKTVAKQSSTITVDNPGITNPKRLSPDISTQSLEKAKTQLKQETGGLLLLKLLPARAALLAWKKKAANAGLIKNDGLDTPGISRELRVRVYQYMLIEFVIFVGLLVPFALIAFFFTQDRMAAVKALVFLLGFFFVYFLDAALISPIIALTIQAEVVKEDKSEF